MDSAARVDRGGLYRHWRQVRSRINREWARDQGRSCRGLVGQIAELPRQAKLPIIRGLLGLPGLKTSWSLNRVFTLPYRRACGGFNP